MDGQYVLGEMREKLLEVFLKMDETIKETGLIGTSEYGNNNIFIVCEVVYNHALQN